MPDIYDLLDKFRRRLLRGERQAASELVRAYGGIWGRLNREILDLVGEYNRSGGQASGTGWFARWERATALQRQAEEELGRLAGLLGRTVEEQGRAAAAQGAEDGVELMGEALGPAPAGAVLGFNRLPVGAIENLVGAGRAAGSPLRDLLEGLPEEGGKIVYEGLLTGLAMGQGARVVARNIRRGLGGQLGRALTIARTETIRAYREATHQTYLANQDIVKGWIWRSARNVRTCASCWAMDGTEHTLEERLDDHPNGRCFEVPKTKTWAELGFAGVPERVSKVGTGAEAFGRLPEADKLRVLGPAKYAALREGKIKLGDLVGLRVDPRWGSIRAERSLKDLGEDAGKWLQRYQENPVVQPRQASETAKQVAELHAQYGGATVSLFQGNMAGKPYHSVSIFPDLSVRVDGRNVTPKQVQDFIKKHEGLARNPKVAVGSWYNPDEDITYLDFSVMVQDREVALSLAKLYNQIGVFDLGEMDYIQTDGTGIAPGHMPPLQDRLKDLP